MNANARPADRLAIALAQLNPTLGDVTGNAAKVRAARATAAGQGADLVIFPELFISGYPPEDLVLKPAFQAACRTAVEGLARETADNGPSVLVGGQDELVFDGASFGLNADRSAAFQLPAFREMVVTTQWVREGGTWRCLPSENALIEEGDQGDYAACVLGLRDYVDKNGFKGVVFGLSGGIDSALCAAIAVDALGASRVRAVMLPYRYTSQDSLEDAAAVAKALGIQYDTVPIAAPVEGFEAALKPLFAGTNRDITEENLQSRTRGTILMAISNKFGLMVVTTGNKSEMSAGYATLYGDMNGGVYPIVNRFRDTGEPLPKPDATVSALEKARDAAFDF